MFTDNMGCLTVILSLSVELLLVRLGWTPRLLTANVPTDVIALLMLGYGQACMHVLHERCSLSLSL